MNKLALSLADLKWAFAVSCRIKFEATDRVDFGRQYEFEENWRA